MEVTLAKLIADFEAGNTAAEVQDAFDLGSEIMAVFVGKPPAFQSHARASFLAPSSRADALARLKDAQAKFAADPKKFDLTSLLPILQWIIGTFIHP